MSEEEIRVNNYIAELEAELSQRKVQQATGNTTADVVNNFNNQNENLIKWQLSIEEELNRIEHLLRRHVPSIDANHNVVYIQSPDAKPIFNEEGIQEILNIIAWYLNKNIILSNFDKEEIKLRVYQFHSVFNNFLFLNARKFGMDTKEKLRYYPMVVTNVVNSVEATYFRAMNGEERESFRTARMVHQSENPSMRYPMGMGGQPQQNKFKLFDPRTWTN